VKALLSVILVGCAAQPIDSLGIACKQDSDCPANTWCDLRFNDDVCRDLDVIQPPNITFDGLVVSGAIVPTITVPTHSVTFHDFRMHDTGSETDAVITFTGPHCVYAASETRSDGDLIRAGDEFDGQFTTDPDPGCASPATLAIDVVASGRTFMFTTTIQISP
jgi:hypothetical protein